MTRTLLTTAAVAALLTTGAFTGAMAQTTTTQPAASSGAATTAPDASTDKANPPGMKSANDVKAKDMADADGHIASTLMGASVYNSPDKNGKTIGKVDDLVIDKGGKEIAHSTKGFGSQDPHLKNFLAGIRSGEALNAEIEEGHKGTLLCHLGNIALRTGHTLNLDPKNGHVQNDPQAEALWSREYRPAWEPKV